MKTAKVGQYTVPAGSELQVILEAVRRTTEDYCFTSYRYAEGYYLYVGLVFGVFGVGVEFDGMGWVKSIDLAGCPE